MGRRHIPGLVAVPTMLSRRGALDRQEAGRIAG